MYYPVMHGAPQPLYRHGAFQQQQDPRFGRVFQHYAPQPHYGAPQHFQAAQHQQGVRPQQFQAPRQPQYPAPRPAPAPQPALHHTRRQPQYAKTSLDAHRNPDLKLHRPDAPDLSLREVYNLIAQRRMPEEVDGDFEFSWIYWLFPSLRTSNMQSHVPASTQQEISWMRQDRQSMDSFNKVFVATLGLFGLREQIDCAGHPVIVPFDKMWWGTYSCFDAAFSRIIDSLQTLGYPERAQALARCLVQLYNNGKIRRQAVDQNHLAIWQRCAGIHPVQGQERRPQYAHPAPQKRGFMGFMRSIFSSEKKVPARPEYAHPAPLHFAVQNPSDLYANDVNRFMCNKGRQSMSLQNLWQACYDLKPNETGAGTFLETCHDYIQWMFPNSRLSGYAPHVPAVPVGTFSRDPHKQKNLRTSFHAIMRFYGLQYNNGVVVWDPKLGPVRAQNWLTQNSAHNPNHNWERLARIMKSLSEAGLHQEAQALKTFLLKDPIVCHYARGSKAYGYWETSCR